MMRDDLIAQYSEARGTALWHYGKARRLGAFIVFALFGWLVMGVSIAVTDIEGQPYYISVGAVGACFLVGWFIGGWVSRAQRHLNQFTHYHDKAMRLYREITNGQ